MAWEAIFATISPFLVIDDNTTKASKMNCKDMKLISIWKVRNYLAYLDDISMLIFKKPLIPIVERIVEQRLVCGLNHMSNEKFVP